MFYEHGRVSPHERMLCWFPKYLQYFTTTQQILHGEDVLSLNMKLYLGIMAVSCYNCEYLLNILEVQFVLNGGDLEWISQGLKKVDQRIAKFAEVNEVLAFMPWRLNAKHI
jgi:hypothetical protein